MPQAPTRNASKTLYYDCYGSPSDPTIMLIMGFSTQCLAWTDKFCGQLAKRGFHVVRFDNRDCGLSSFYDELGVPSIPWTLLKKR